MLIDIEGWGAVWEVETGWTDNNYYVIFNIFDKGNVVTILIDKNVGWTGHLINSYHTTSLSVVSVIGSKQ